jgi:cytochrome c oxidase subunit 2
MGRIAIVIAVSYAILGGALVVVIGAIVWSSTLGRRREIDAKKLGERERTWFGIVVVLLVALLFATIFFTPYGRSAGSNGQRVDVTAQQFAFLVPGKTLKAGEPVDFRLTSRDVNHGFAVYNSDDEFLFQVQVMPGKTQEYVYTFEKPGTYHIVCFEYCGVGHDQMAGAFRVALKVAP